MRPLPVLRAEGGALLAAAHADLDRPVPSCPGWDVRRLVAHVGRVHRFCASHVARGSIGPPPPAPRAPRDDGVLEWYAEGLAELLLLLDAVDPALPAWNFSPAAPKVAAFWPRRMAHETAVHRWDAQAASGPPVAFDPPVAADGVDEVLTVLVPHHPARAEGGPGPDGSVHVHLTDTPGEWLVRLAGTAVEVTSGHAGADSALRGPASDTLLALWGRRPLDAPPLEVLGDPELAAAVRTG